MAIKFIIFVLIFLVSSLCVHCRLKGPKHGKVVVCQLSPLLLSTQPNFHIDDIDFSVCTHLVLTNGAVKDTNYSIYFETGNNDKIFTREFMATIKSQYPSIKIITSIALIAENVGRIRSNIPKSQRSRDKFIMNTAAHVRQYGLDGVDIFIYSFPETGDNLDDLLNLMQDLKEEFQSYDYILTATLPLFDKLLNTADQLVVLNRYVDLLQISTNNYFQLEEKPTRVFVPLKSKNKSDKNSVEYTIKHLLEKGIEANKLILMVTLFALTHNLNDRDIKDVPIEDIIAMNTFRGAFPYVTICEDTKSEQWFEEFSMPYIRIHSFNTMIYENPRSIVNKVKMAMSYDLKGVSMYNLQIDDYEGKCNISDDTYLEFVDSYNKLINEEPNLLQRLEDLNLPNADAAGNLGRGISYGVFNNKLHFRAPQLRPGPYPIFRAINQAITLSLEEKKILDALKTNGKEPVRKFCLFWPKCATSILTPEPETSS